MILVTDVNGNEYVIPNSMEQQFVAANEELCNIDPFNDEWMDRILALSDEFGEFARAN